MGKFFEGSGGSLISGAIGMVGGAISDRRNYKNQLKLVERQQQYNKELGEINQGYAKEMAAINQQYALQAGKQSHLYNQEMWDYTNYENQVEHMKAAGLNPALLYSKGGAGGSTAGAGTAAGLISQNFNAIPLLGYLDIFKNYYANKQEESFKYIGADPYLVVNFSSLNLNQIS